MTMNNPLPSFEATHEEFNLIEQIAQRSIRLGVYLPGDTMKALMDVTACNANGCPLKLADMLEADDSNFVHDAAGIRNHIDRDTGKLLDCFMPRFAQQIAA